VLRNSSTLDVHLRFHALIDLTSCVFSSALSELLRSPHLKRLVITSSVAAVVDPNPRGEKHSGGPPYTMDEEDWNEYSPKVVEEKGVDAPGSDKYRASKVSCMKCTCRERKRSRELIVFLVD
jgi:nucleoside-diphosphate-sugar epimerase